MQTAAAFDAVNDRNSAWPYLDLIHQNRGKPGGIAHIYIYKVLSSAVGALHCIDSICYHTGGPLAIGDIEEAQCACELRSIFLVSPKGMDPSIRTPGPLAGAIV